MNLILYDDGGKFRTAEIIAEAEQTLQVVTDTNRRVKLKKQAVLLSFSANNGPDFIQEAQALSANIDIDFVWECADDHVFCAHDFAQLYFSETPNTIEIAAIFFTLWAHPIYFRRKGQGYFQKAPAELIQAALAGQEKKKAREAHIANLVDQLSRHILPEDMVGKRGDWLNGEGDSVYAHALRQVKAQTGLSIATILYRCGLWPTAWAFHRAQFLLNQGSSFTATGDADSPSVASVTTEVDWPISPVAAFAIDSKDTTEVDDAVSVTPLADGAYQIGIHIAAPSAEASTVQQLETYWRKRLATVYTPAEKWTMLPPSIMQKFSLITGALRPVVSMYFTFDAADQIINPCRYALERLTLTANLDVAYFAKHINIAKLEDDAPWPEPDLQPYESAFKVLWRFCRSYEQHRGENVSEDKLDYQLHVTGDALCAEPPCHVDIHQRQRANPIDRIVAATMIFANHHFAEYLSHAQIAAIYRCQVAGKAKMGLHPERHEGLGLSSYAWCTSPLRRAVDLVNQWQFVQSLQQQSPIYSGQDKLLWALIRDFELSHQSYALFQRQMEKFWFLYKLRHEATSELAVICIKSQLVKAIDWPLVFKPSGMPEMLEGTLGLVRIDHIDLIDLSLRAQWLAIRQDEDA